MRMAPKSLPKSKDKVKKDKAGRFARLDREDAADGVMEEIEEEAEAAEEGPADGASRSTGEPVQRLTVSF